MLAAERQAMIVELIRENGSVQVDELAKELDVSAMTIRRDLVKLQNSNMIERCHGGAVAKQEVAYETKQTSNKDSKEAIAKNVWNTLTREILSFWTQEQQPARSQN